MAIQFKFDAEKMIQAISCILDQTGPTTKIPVLKLLFLADVDHLKKHGRPISGDHPYAMKLGPVLTETYDLLCRKRKGEQTQNRFEQYIRLDSNGKDVSLKKPTKTDHLSDSDKQSLKCVLKKFGGWSAKQLSDYTHNLKAYRRAFRQSDQDSSVRMKWEDILEEAPDEVRAMVNERQAIRRCLDR